MLDGHIHLQEHAEDYSSFYNQIEQAGASGGVVLSLPPGPRGRDGGVPGEERISGVVQCAAGHPGLYPFFWIDPIAENAASEVELAIDAGVKGFKVICSDFFPGDSRALKTYRVIAATGRPVLFHSGILWDGMDSSRYNRPAEFEALIDVEGLRFSLAHISWPWCDELIAVYGKFLAARGRKVEMFIDTTPGTPRIYRKEALTKLFTVGYDVEHNVIFGSDCSAPDYNSPWTKEWYIRDSEILDDLGLSENVKTQVFGGNLERFLGISSVEVARKSLRPGE
jgi:predicted TIM-barrel fold metal-dependent hydrolase